MASPASPRRSRSISRTANPFGRRVIRRHLNGDPRVGSAAGSAAGSSGPRYRNATVRAGRRPGDGARFDRHRLAQRRLVRAGAKRVVAGREDERGDGEAPSPFRSRDAGREQARQHRPTGRCRRWAASRRHTRFRETGSARACRRRSPGPWRCGRRPLSPKRRPGRAPRRLRPAARESAAPARRRRPSRARGRGPADRASARGAPPGRRGARR